MTGSRPVAGLLAAAAAGDRTAWDQLVERYAGLVVAVCRWHRLSESDVADVSQTVWLRLVEQLSTIRQPEALPGWLVTTARRESLRVLRHARRQLPIDIGAGFDGPPDVEAATPERELVEAERAQALRDAFAGLPLPCQRLLALLIEDPRPAYEDIARRLGMPVGSIGPTRARCLARLRRSPSVAALIEGRQDVGATGS